MKLDKQKIEDLCKKYNCNYKIFDTDAVITTGLDEWAISLDYKGKLLLKHINKTNGRITKHNYHVQKYIPDIEYAFDVVISRHQCYDTAYNKAFRIKNILEKLRIAQ